MSDGTTRPFPASPELSHDPAPAGMVLPAGASRAPDILQPGMLIVRHASQQRNRSAFGNADPAVIEALTVADRLLSEELDRAAGLLGGPSLAETADVEPVAETNPLLVVEGFDWDDEGLIRESLEQLRSVTRIDADGDVIDIARCAPERRAYYALVSSRRGYVWRVPELAQLVLHRTTLASRRQHVRDIYTDVQTDGHPDNVLEGRFVRRDRGDGMGWLYAFVGSSRQPDYAGHYIRRAGQGGLEDVPEEAESRPLMMQEDVAPDPTRLEYEVLGEIVKVEEFPPGQHDILRYMLTNRRLFPRQALLRLYEDGLSNNARSSRLAQFLDRVQLHSVLRQAFSESGEPRKSNRRMGFPLSKESTPEAEAPS